MFRPFDTAVLLSWMFRSWFILVSQHEQDGDSFLLFSCPTQELTGVLARAYTNTGIRLNNFFIRLC